MFTKVNVSIYPQTQVQHLLVRKEMKLFMESQLMTIHLINLTSQRILQKKKVWKGVNWQ